MTDQRFPAQLTFTLLPLAVLTAALEGAAQDKAAAAEQVRSHPLLKKEIPEGQRENLAIGTLFLPKLLERAGKVPLFVHFHGGDWLPECAAARHGKTAVITVQLGTGSAVYAKPFQDPKAFGQLVQEAEKKAGVEFGPISLTGWSAGYGAIRESSRIRTTASASRASCCSTACTPAMSRTRLPWAQPNW